MSNHLQQLMGTNTNHHAHPGNESVLRQRIILIPLSCDIGTIRDDLFTAIKRISIMRGKVHVEAYSDGDTYSSGPVHPG